MLGSATLRLFVEEGSEGGRGSLNQYREISFLDVHFAHLVTRPVCGSVESARCSQGESMGALPRKWIKWVGVLLGVVGMLTPALLELGWIPFQRRLTAERDPSYEGRMHFRFIESPVTSDIRGGAIVFGEDPQGARLVSSFIRHQWLEQPDVTMSLSEACERCKAIKGTAAIGE
jgi:hypothetical protein